MHFDTKMSQSQALLSSVMIYLFGKKSYPNYLQSVMSVILHFVSAHTITQHADTKGDRLHPVPNLYKTHVKPFNQITYSFSRMEPGRLAQSVQ
jgi:hypothetical protein